MQLVKRASANECEAMFRRDVERHGHRPFDDRRRRYDRYRDKHRGPRAAIAYVQNNNGSFNSTSGTISFLSAVTAADTLFCCVSPINTSSAAYTIGVSDNINGPWTQAGAFFDAFNCQANLFYFPNAAAGSPTITITSSTSATIGLGIIEYSGLATASPIDVTPTGTATTSGASFPCPNVTTTNANDLILACLAYGGNQGTTTVGGAYTLRFTNSTDAVMFGEQIVSSATTYTGATFTITFSGSPGFGITSSWKALGGTTPSVALDFTPGAGGRAVPSAVAIPW
jgi:hypothetical protein